MDYTLDDEKMTEWQNSAKLSKSLLDPKRTALSSAVDGAAAAVEDASLVNALHDCWNTQIAVQCLATTSRAETVIGALHAMTLAYKTMQHEQVAAAAEAAENIDDNITPLSVPEDWKKGA